LTPPIGADPRPFRTCGGPVDLLGARVGIVDVEDPEDRAGDEADEHEHQQHVQGADGHEGEALQQLPVVDLAEPREKEAQDGGDTRVLCGLHGSVPPRWFGGFMESASARLRRSANDPVCSGSSLGLSIPLMP
jgi:hypothetical protein